MPRTGGANGRLDQTNPETYQQNGLKLRGQQAVQKGSTSQNARASQAWLLAAHSEGPRGGRQEEAERGGREPASSEHRQSAAAGANSAHVWQSACACGGSGEGPSIATRSVRDRATGQRRGQALERCEQRGPEQHGRSWKTPPARPDSASPSLTTNHPRGGSRQHAEARAEHRRPGKDGLKPEVAERQARHTQKRIGRPDFRKSRAERRTAQQQPEDRPEAERMNPLT